MSEKRKKEHDFLFKKLNDVVCEDLISITFPDLITWIDFSNAIRADININDVAHFDSKLYADAVILAPHKSDDGKVVIGHIEFQSYKQKEYENKLAQRMYQYHCRLYGIFGDYFPNKKEYPQFKGKECVYVPLAIMSNKCPEDTPTQFKVISQDMKSDGEYNVDKFVVSEYNYRKKHLRSLNWKEFQNSKNVAAVALLGNMNHEESDKPQLKLAALKLIYGDSIRFDKNTEELLVAFVETYLLLEGEQEKQFKDLLSKVIESNPSLGGKIMSGLSGITTKWHADGKKEMLIENIVVTSAEKFGIDENEVKALLEDELNKMEVEEGKKIIRSLTRSKSLKDFIDVLTEINK